MKIQPIRPIYKIPKQLPKKTKDEYIKETKDNQIIKKNKPYIIGGISYEKCI